jgi:hypothetical protein
MKFSSEHFMFQICPFGSECAVHNNDILLKKLISNPSLWPACTLWGEGDPASLWIKILQTLISQHEQLSEKELIHHADIYLVYATENSEITLDLIRELHHFSRTGPIYGAYKWILIEGNRLSPSCQQALLKLCEAPPIYLRMVMICEHPHQILPTLKARFFPIHWSLCSIPVLTIQNTPWICTVSSHRLWKHYSETTLQEWRDIIMKTIQGISFLSTLRKVSQADHKDFQIVLLHFLHQGMIWSIDNNPSLLNPFCESWDVLSKNREESLSVYGDPEAISLWSLQKISKIFKPYHFMNKSILY